MGRIAIIRVDHVARGAAARAIVAGMIVRAGERKNRIEQSRLLQAKKYGIRAQFGSKTSFAELIVGLAGLFFAIRIADLRFLAPASFEDPQHIAGLRSFPAQEWIELGKDSFGASFFRRWLRRGLDRLRLPVTIVTFAEPRVLCGIAAVVIERRAPKESGVRHHARRHRTSFSGVATSGTASFGSDAQIPRVYKFYILRGFRKPFCVRAFGKRRAIFEHRVVWLNVGFLFYGIVFRKTCAPLLHGTGRGTRRPPARRPRTNSSSHEERREKITQRRRGSKDFAEKAFLVFGVGAFSARLRT